MSWSVTINNLQEYEGFSTEVIEQMLTQNPQYPADMEIALDAARRSGISSGVLSGGRTPNPYGDDEVVNISIQGMGKAVDFNTAMRRIIDSGPDQAALAKQSLAEPVAMG